MHNGFLSDRVDTGRTGDADGGVPTQCRDGADSLQPNPSLRRTYGRVRWGTVMSGTVMSGTVIGDGDRGTVIGGTVIGGR